MKVFLSWSGETSHRVACAFRDWLPSVLQFVTPYVSSEDIDKGARWSSDIAHELEQAAYGILMITHENIGAPWIAFEAGALSKSIEKSRVTPFLFDLKRSDVQGPLLQFQSTVRARDDVQKLVESINKSAEEKEQLTAGLLNKVFSVWWPQLEEALNSIPTPICEVVSDPGVTQNSDSAPILEEILELVRAQHRLLNNPASLLPAEYLREISIAQSTDLGGKKKYAGIAKWFHSKLDDLESLYRTISGKSRPYLTNSEVSDFQTLIQDLRRVDQAMPRIEEMLGTALIIFLLYLKL